MARVAVRKIHPRIIPAIQSQQSICENFAPQKITLYGNVCHRVEVKHAGKNEVP